MKAVEDMLINALLHNKTYVCSKNTAVYKTDPAHMFPGLEVWLFGNHICTKAARPNLPIAINLCGYDTTTTRSRLNAIVKTFCKANICRENGETFIQYLTHRTQLPHEGWVLVPRALIRITPDY